MYNEMSRLPLFKIEGSEIKEMIGAKIAANAAELSRFEVALAQVATDSRTEEILKGSSRYLQTENLQLAFAREHIDSTESFKMHGEQLDRLQVDLYPLPSTTVAAVIEELNRPRSAAAQIEGLQSEAAYRERLEPARSITSAPFRRW